MGRPSVDPELMIRMLFACYCMGVRSERRLCEEVHLNLAYRWFCGLGLDGKVRDHSTFSKNRHGRFCQSDMLRRLSRPSFSGAWRRVWSADGFAVDASFIAADANKQRSVPSREWKPEEVKENAVRAAREYLAALDNAAFGAASPMTPKFISRSDPAVQAPPKSRGICMKTSATRRNSGIRGGLSPAEESRDAVAHLKRILRRTRLRLRCPKGDNDEFLLAATSQNLSDSLAKADRYASRKCWPHNARHAGPRAAQRRPSDPSRNTASPHTAFSTVSAHSRHSVGYQTFDFDHSLPDYSARAGAAGCDNGNCRKSGMRHKFCQESPRRQDTHGLILTERQQILVPGDNCARLDRESRCNDVIVIRITAGRAISGSGP